jgi:hypothetical protein
VQLRITDLMVLKILFKNALEQVLRITNDQANYA